MTHKVDKELQAKEKRMLMAIKYQKSQSESDEKKSLYWIARMFHMSHSTLKHRIAGRPSCQQSRESLQKLFTTSESMLVRWITQLTVTGYSPSHTIVREMAEVLRRKQLGLDSGMIAGMPLGCDWVRNFLRRHPELKTVVGKTIEKSHIKSTSPEVLKKWFDAFEREVIKDKNVLPENVYNMDESG